MRLCRSRTMPPASRAGSARSNQVPGLGSLSASPRARCRAPGVGRGPQHRRLGEALQRRRGCAPARRSPAGPGRRRADCRRGPPCGVVDRIERGIGQPLQRVGREAGGGGRAKADRGGEAFADGDAVVAPARRQVEHVARLEQPVLGGLEAGQHLQRHVVAQARPRHPADPPAPPPGDLEQEHVVRIDVRPDAAAVARVGEHDVVEPRIGHEAKALQQAMRRRRRAGRRPAPAGSSPASPSGGERAARDRPGTQRPALAAADRPAATRRPPGRPGRTAGAGRSRAADRRARRERAAASSASAGA